MSREFSGVWVEFGSVGDFVFTNGSLLWGCHFRSSLAFNQQRRWKWPRTSKDFAFYNPTGGIIDRCHHTWLSLIIYIFFCNKKFRIHFLTPNQGIKFVFVFTCIQYFGDHEVLAVLFCPSHDHFIRNCSYIDDILCNAIIFIISNCLYSVSFIHRNHALWSNSWYCTFTSLTFKYSGDFAFILSIIWLSCCMIDIFIL